MPRTASGSAIYRPDLGLSVMEYIEGDTMGRIGLELLPLFPTKIKSGTYPVIPLEALLELPKTARAPRSGYGRGDYETERGLFSTSEHGREEALDDEEQATFDQETRSGIAGMLAVKRAMNIILRAQEKRIADKLFNPTNMSNGGAVSKAWVGGTDPTPIDDVNDARESIRRACGILPNTLVLAYPTFQKVKRCSQIVELLKYTFPGIDMNKMTSTQLAHIFDVERLLIGGGVYNSAKRNNDAIITDFWSTEYALLTRTATDTGDLQEPSLGRTFLWTEDSPGNPIVEEYRDEGVRADIFRCRHHIDERLIQGFDEDGSVVSNIAAGCSYLLSNITKK